MTPAIIIMATQALARNRNIYRVTQLNCQLSWKYRISVVSVVNSIVLRRRVVDTLYLQWCERRGCPACVQSARHHRLPSLSAGPSLAGAPAWWGHVTSVCLNSSLITRTNTATYTNTTIIIISIVTTHANLSPSSPFLPTQAGSRF